MPLGNEIAYVVYQVNDLDLMESFMQDFGLLTAHKDDKSLFMRGAGTSPFLHVTLLGDENKFIGAAIRMESMEDLHELAKLPGSSAVTKVDDYPGGGWRVRMMTPDNVQIDAIWGQEPAEEITHRPPNPFNAGHVKTRYNASLRPKREPGLALRIGHFVLRVSNHPESVKWFHERFGLLASDYMCVPGDKSQVIGTFLRMDKGEEFVDHHSMLIVQAQVTGVHHCSFEFQDLDSVMGSHDYLVAKGHRLDCGVGRHLIGSQIFDYWRDPFGFRVEHYTDGDVVNEDYEPLYYDVFADDTTQWGMDPTRDFFE